MPMSIWRIAFIWTDYQPMVLQNLRCTCVFKTMSSGEWLGERIIILVKKVEHRHSLLPCYTYFIEGPSCSHCMRRAITQGWFFFYFVFWYSSFCVGNIVWCVQSGNHMLLLEKAHFVDESRVTKAKSSHSFPTHL